MDTDHLTEEQTSESLQNLLMIDNKVIENVRKYGEIVEPHLEKFIDEFYDWMRGTPYHAAFFADPNRMERTKKQQISYWREFFKCDLSEQYLHSRRSLGELHAHIGLPLTAYFAGMDVSLSLLLEAHGGNIKGKELLDCTHAVTRMVHFDSTIVTEMYSKIVSQRIADQSNSLLAMSTPVTSLWDGILLLPIFGIIDSARAQEIMQSSLTMISKTSAEVFIFDISGVSVVDTAVANHLVKVIRASELMGCSCILSGLSPAIAQTIVELGIDVSNINTTSNLRNAMKDAFDTLGIKLDEG